MYGVSSYNATECRLQTWRALVDIWQSGGARSIGVSNFNQIHLEEIEAAGLPLPSVNQVPFYLYLSTSQIPTLEYCKSKNILFNGYSPFGVPDRRTYAPPMSPTTLQDPVVLQIAAAHGRAPAEIILAWQQQLGIVVNPRSQNAAHFWENLNYFDITLTDQEMTAMGGRPQI